MDDLTKEKLSLAHRILIIYIHIIMFRVFRVFRGIYGKNQTVASPRPVVAPTRWTCVFLVFYYHGTPGTPGPARKNGGVMRVLLCRGRHVTRNTVPG